MNIDISDEKIIDAFLEIFRKDNCILSEENTVELLSIIAKVSEKDESQYIENLVFYMGDSLKNFIKKISDSIESNPNGLDPFY